VNSAAVTYSSPSGQAAVPAGDVSILAADISLS
jgi:hypothetical protein